MTEQEWLASDDPQPMLAFLQESKMLTDRKARLVAAACCRRIWADVTDERSRRAVEASELYADGEVSRLRLDEAEVEAEQARAWAADSRAMFTALAMKMATSRRISLAMLMDLTHADHLVGKGERYAKRVAQVRLLHDIGGNPFHPVTLDRSALTPPVASLAQTAYEDRLMPSGHLELARLAILSDALEESGVTGEILTHLRSPGPHVRGCWAVDLVLGRS
jgi:hypothetical protein